MDVPQPERPHVPDSFGFSIEDYAFEPMSWQWVTEQLESARNYWIVTTRPSGRPHSVPVWGVWVDDAFHFATDPLGVTAQNLKQNPESVVNLESGDEVVILEGQFTLHDSTKEIQKAFNTKYDMPWGAEETIPVFTLELKKALAWTESDYPSNATRWRF
ncbi:MAG: pyridoxamine 5'-phosphate oxidase family protein [Chloroflexi bacterium]|nr:pyridoxamine 5'-phosphate oxidase family protein [Chloroflexota bacterium]